MSKTKLRWIIKILLANFTKLINATLQKLKLRNSSDYFVQPMYKKVLHSVLQHICTRMVFNLQTSIGCFKDYNRWKTIMHVINTIIEVTNSKQQTGEGKHFQQNVWGFEQPTTTISKFCYNPIEMWHECFICNFSSTVHCEGRKW